MRAKLIKKDAPIVGAGAVNEPNLENKLANPTAESLEAAARRIVTEGQVAKKKLSEADLQRRQAWFGRVR